MRTGVMVSPIGGVAAFDPEQGGVISAGGVGFDISWVLSEQPSTVRWPIVRLLRI